MKAGELVVLLAALGGCAVTPAELDSHPPASPSAALASFASHYPGATQVVVEEAPIPGWFRDDERCSNNFTIAAEVPADPREGRPAGGVRALLTEAGETVYTLEPIEIQSLPQAVRAQLEPVLGAGITWAFRIEERAHRDYEVLPLELSFRVLLEDGSARRELSFDAEGALLGAEELEEEGDSELDDSIPFGLGESEAVETSLPDDVPKALESCLRARFGEISDLGLGTCHDDLLLEHREHTWFTAEFGAASGFCQALLTSTGTILHCEIELGLEELPQVIRRRVGQEFPRARFQVARRIESYSRSKYVPSGQPRTGYLVVVSRGGVVSSATFTAEGEVLRRELGYS